MTRLSMYDFRFTNPFDRLRARMLPFEPSAWPELEAKARSEADLLKELGPPEVSGLGKVANLLDVITGASSARDVLSALASGQPGRLLTDRNPFDQLAHPLTHRERGQSVGFRDVMTESGLFRPNQETGLRGWSDPKEAALDLLGFAGEVATDPGTWFGSQIVKGYAKAGQAAADIAKATRPGAAAMGAAQRVTDPLVDQFMAAFSKPAMGMKGAEERALGRAVTAGRETAAVGAGERTAPLIEQWGRFTAGMGQEDYLRSISFMEDAVEETATLPPNMAHLQGVRDAARQAFDERPIIEQAGGVKSKTIEDVYEQKYAPRRRIFSPNEERTMRSGTRRGVTGYMAEQIKREEFLTDIFGSTGLIKRLSINPEFSGIAHKIRPDLLNDAFWKTQTKKLTDVLEAGGRNYTFEKQQELAKWLAHLDPWHAKEKIPAFLSDPMEALKHRIEVGDTLVQMNAVARDTMKGSVLKAGDARLTPDYVKADQVFDELGFDVDKSMELLRKDAGVEVASGRIGVRTPSGMAQQIPDISTDTAQREFFKNTQTGKPIAAYMYRTEEKGRRDYARGVFFGSKGFAEELSPILGGKVKRELVEFRNPLVIQSKGVFLDELAKQGDAVAASLHKSLIRSIDTMFDEAPAAASAAQIEKHIANYARSQGYDGIISQMDMEAVALGGVKKAPATAAKAADATHENVGMIVRASDRDYYGTITKGSGDNFEVEFTNPASGLKETKTYDVTDLTQVGRSRQGQEELFVPKEIADRLKKVSEAYRSPDKIADSIFKPLQQYTQIWKNWVTSRPAFHTRNFYSGQFFNWMNNMFSPKTVAATWKLLHGKSVDAPWEKMGPAYKGLSNEEATNVFRREVFAHKVAERGQGVVAEGTSDTLLSKNLAADIPGLQPIGIRESLQRGGNLNPFSEDFRLFNVSRGLGETTEGLNRISPYMHLRLQGVDAAQAAARVKAAQIDYTDLTQFEREYMRPWFPFYSFTKGISKKVANELLEKPGGKLAQTLRAQHDAQSQELTMPQHLSEGGAIPLGAKEDGSKSYIAGLGLMHETPLAFLGGNGGLAGLATGAAAEVASLAGPAPKFVLEALFNESLNQRGPMGGRDLSEMDPTLGRMLTSAGLREDTGTGRAKPFISPLFEHAFNNSPFSSLGSIGRTLLDDRKAWYEKAFNTASGVKFTDVSPQHQDAVLRQRADRIAIDDLGGVVHQSTYIPSKTKQREAARGGEAHRRIELVGEIVSNLDKKKRERDKAERLKARQQAWNQTAF